MAHSLKLKKIVVAMLLVSLGTSFVAEASMLDSALDGMFANLTGAGIAKTPDRTAFVGGGLAIRTPVSSINLVTFDPPRLSAGCGGLDMFGGSFSFINADQLVALFRKIAANAVGLAFKAAIDAINPQLGKLMAEFQKLVNDLNGATKNSCMLAKQLTDNLMPSKDVMASMVPDMTSGLQSSIGAVDDWFKGITNTATNGEASAQQATKALNITYGNGVWRVINAKNLGAMLTDPTSVSSFTADKNSNEILMSLTGTYVNYIEADGSDPSGAILDKTGNGIYSHVIEISDLQNGGDLTKYVCDPVYVDDTNPGCENITTTTFHFDGMEGHVKNILFGVGGGTGLVDALASGTPLSTQQKTLLQSTGVPVMALLNAVGTDQLAQQQALSYMSPVIARGMLISYLYAVQKITKEIENNATSPLKGRVQYRLDYLNEKAQELALDQDKEVVRINEISAFVQNVRMGNIATFYSVSKR